jgi:hypothetical protein
MKKKLNDQQLLLLIEDEKVDELDEKVDELDEIMEVGVNEVHIHQ